MFAVIKRKSLILGVITAAVLSLLIALTAVSGSYVVAQGKTPRKLPIYCVEREDGLVSLSFDASWGSDSTEEILSTLKQYNAEANYFVVSLWVNKYPDLLKKLSDSGIIEIGMHSATHPDMKKLSAKEIEEEILSNRAAIERVTGIKPSLFRAPYGSYSDTLMTMAENAGIKVIQWDVDSLDWKNLSSGEIAARVLNNVKSGSIILLHNDGLNTAKALPVILEGLLNKGLKPVKISRLIYEDNYEIDHTGKQIPKKAKE